MMSNGPVSRATSEPTSDDARYKANPARDVEKIAIAMVRDWVDMAGTLNDMSATGGCDFAIDYADGRLGVGEVTWHADRQIQEMWGRTFRMERHQVIELPPELGTWVLTLVTGARIDALPKALPALIAQLAAAPRPWLDITPSWPRGAMADEARRLGIEHIHRVQIDAPNEAVFFMPSTGGAVPEDPNVIPEWIESVLNSTEYADNYKKLLAVEADERHVVLMSGSATPFGADERLRRVKTRLPTRQLHVPDGITHVWALPQFALDPVAVFWSGGTWNVVPVPLIPL
jgi:hypothetical protein